MTIFHKILATTALCLAAVGLSSCSFILQTHQMALDMAKEYDAIVVLHDAVYQAGNRFYVQGGQTKRLREDGQGREEPRHQGLQRLGLLGLRACFCA